MTSTDEPTELPIEGWDPESLIGREQELEEIGRLLEESRLVTAYGVTGIGKTRLAEAAAVNLWPAYGHGVAFVDLSLLTAGSGLLAWTIGENLPTRLRDSSKGSGDQALVKLLSQLSPRKKLLIILDNCEDHTTEVAELCREMLRAARAVRILATSRIPLGLREEQRYAVPPLELNQALQLVVAGAKQDNRSFTLTEANTKVLTGLCEDLDCIPLALELAASNLHTRSAEDLRKNLLTIKPPVEPLAPPRVGHESVAAMVWVTWDDCTPQQRALWTRLCQLVGHWDTDAAVEIGTCEDVPAEDVPGVLSALVIKRIVVHDKPGSPTPYRMPETFRRAGQRQAEQEALTDAVLLKHAKHYGKVVSAAAQCYYTEREHHGLSSIGAHLPNVRLALDTCTKTRALRRDGLTMASALAGILAWWWVGSLSEGLMWLQRMLAANPEASAARVIALAQQAFFVACRGDHEEAGLLLEQASLMLAECRASAGTDSQVGSASDLAYASATLAGLYGAHRWLSGYADSVDLMLAAAEEMRVLGHPGPRYLFRALAVYSGARYACDRREEMLRFADWLLSDARAHGNPIMNGAWAWAIAGLTQLLHADRGRAVQLLREALRQQLTVGDQWGPGLVGLLLAEALAVTGQVDVAATVLRASEALVDRSGMPLEAMPPLNEGAEITRGLVREAAGDAALELVIEDPEATLMALLSPKTTPPSRRELEVAALIADPRSLKYADIADELEISVKTVQTYVDRLKNKLGLSRPEQIARWYRQHQNDSAS